MRVAVPAVVAATLVSAAAAAAVVVAAGAAVVVVAMVAGDNCQRYWYDVFALRWTVCNELLALEGQLCLL